jgi:hypothetical protein
VAGENYVMRGFIICDLRISTLWSEKRKGRNQFEDVNVDARITVRRDHIVSTEFMWPRIENTVWNFYIVYSGQNYDEVTNLCNTSKCTIL